MVLLLKTCHPTWQWTSLDFDMRLVLVTAWNDE
jgi:hypothetical protein